MLGVHKSTICRELARNTGKRSYRPKQAQHETELRRVSARKHIRFTDSIKQQVESHLCRDLSPEQIVGYLASEKQIHISHETIYQHIWADKKAGGNLHSHLRWSNKKRRKRYAKNDRRGQIPDRVSIEQRPELVDKKKRIGDWEIDTVIGHESSGRISDRC